MRLVLTLAIASALTAACQPESRTPTEESEPNGSATPDAVQAVSTEPAPAYDGLSVDETVHFTGTEPFWGGEIADGAARYSTPENIEGSQFAVTRFAGNNGVTYSGTLDGRSFDLMITPGSCSDGMSDRTYPFVATLTLGEEQRNGCAWTDSQDFSGPRNP